MTEKLTRRQEVLQSKAADVLEGLQGAFGDRSPGSLRTQFKGLVEDVMGTAGSAALKAVVGVRERVSNLETSLASSGVTLGAMKETYGCDGTSLRQHNEPAGNQVIFHFHLHVFPRWEGDNLYANHENNRSVSVDERAPYAEKLRAYFQE